MKEDTILVKNAEVLETLPNAMFRVLLPEFNTNVLATIGGKMRKHKIRVQVGDSVDVEVSPYDTSRGRIIFRHKS